MTHKKRRGGYSGSGKPKLGWHHAVREAKDRVTLKESPFKSIITEGGMIRPWGTKYRLQNNFPDPKQLIYSCLTFTAG